MKIVCESCAAKYSIADEKVAGRVFKIRCKKCGAAIVVRGDQGASEAAPAAGAAAGFDYGGEAVWHAVVDGEQQGPFAPSQLGSMISAGSIGWDAYVWREGFEDWKPAQDIEELVQAIMNPGGAPAAEDPFTDAPTLASPSPAEAAPKATKSGRDAGADLFAQSEASPFGGGGEDDDVVASAASPRVSANQAMTGARNENSVLFSLSNLQALATGSPGGGGGGGGGASSSSSRGPASAAPKAGMAMGEGSGLIDIRALANATGLTGGGGSSAPSMGSSPAKIDDLMSIGSPSVGLGSALGAPVIIPEKKESSGGGGNTMILAAAIIAVALLGGAGIFAYITVNQPDPAATAPAAVAAIAPGATAAPPTAPVAPAPVAEAAPTTTAVAAPPPEAPSGTPSTPSSSGSSSSRRGSHGSSSSSSSSASPSAPSAPSAPSSSPSSSSRSSSDRDIDSLLEGALGAPTPRRGSTSSSAPSSSASEDSSLAATPSRSDVTTAMGRVQSDVSACGGGEHGVATVQIAVAGSTGRVSNATVGGQFAGTPVGSCIARAVRGASFPHFRNPTFSFTYPFRL